MKKYIFVIILFIMTAFVINGCQEAVKVEKAEVIKQTAEPNDVVMATKEADLPVPPPPPAEPAIVTEPLQVPKAVEPNIVKEQPKAEVQIEPNKPAEPNVSQAQVSVPVEIAKPAAEVNVVTAAKSANQSFVDSYAALLKNYVNSDGYVNYEVLKRKRIEILQTLDALAKVDAGQYEAFTKDEKIVFWINAYNARMLYVIIENYPVQSSALARLWYPPNSLRLIEPASVVGTAKWDKYKFTLMNEEFTLSEIEKRFFLKEFNDPRIIFALNFASVGGPQFRNEPYKADKLNEQLDEQIKKYLATPAGFKIDEKDQSVHLNGLLQDTWYGSYFTAVYGTDKKFKIQEANVRAVLNFVSKYVEPAKVNFLEKGIYSVMFMPYDWRLNEPSSMR